VEQDARDFLRLVGKIDRLVDVGGLDRECETNVAQQVAPPRRRRGENQGQPLEGRFLSDELKAPRWKSLFRLPATAAYFRVEHERDRAVVHEIDDHVGAELPRLDAHSGRFDVALKLIEPWNRLVGGRRGVERRPPPLANISVERELRDEQHLTADLHDRTVHAPLVVGEDTDGGDLSCDPLAVVRRVPLLDPDENEEALADRSDRVPLDTHGGLRDSLDQRSHGWDRITAGR
jgi:hypothetical protein